MLESYDLDSSLHYGKGAKWSGRECLWVVGELVRQGPVGVLNCHFVAGLNEFSCLLSYQRSAGARLIICGLLPLAVDKDLRAIVEVSARDGEFLSLSGHAGDGRDCRGNVCEAVCEHAR